MFAAVAQEVALGQRGTENALAIGALDRAIKGRELHLGHRHLPCRRGPGPSARPFLRPSRGPSSGRCAALPPAVARPFLRPSRGPSSGRRAALLPAAAPPSWI